jgi:hypothetical protein
MSSKDDLPLIIKYDCVTEYYKIIECIKVNDEKINRCDVKYPNPGRYSNTR